MRVPRLAIAPHMQGITHKAAFGRLFFDGRIADAGACCPRGKTGGSCLPRGCTPGEGLVDSLLFTMKLPQQEGDLLFERHCLFAP
jgi:hypothetical protein